MTINYERYRIHRTSLPALGFLRLPYSEVIFCHLPFTTTFSRVLCTIKQLKYYSYLNKVFLVPACYLTFHKFSRPFSLGCS